MAILKQYTILLHNIIAKIKPIQHCPPLYLMKVSRDEYNALKNLPSLKNIIIPKSDKGNSIGLMNHDDYISRMETLRSDPAKFQKLLAPENKD